MGPKARWADSDLVLMAAAGPLALMGDSDRAPVRLSVHGSFMVHNALAAAAAGHLLGVGIEEIRQGLEGFSPVPGRMWPQQM